MTATAARGKAVSSLAAAHILIALSGCAPSASATSWPKAFAGSPESSEPAFEFQYHLDECRKLATQHPNEDNLPGPEAVFRKCMILAGDRVQMPDGRVVSRADFDRKPAGQSVSREPPSALSPTGQLASEVVDSVDSIKRYAARVIAAADAVKWRCSGDGDDKIIEVFSVSEAGQVSWNTNHQMPNPTMNIAGRVVNDNGMLVRTTFRVFSDKIVVRSSDGRQFFTEDQIYPQSMTIDTRASVPVKLGPTSSSTLPIPVHEIFSCSIMKGALPPL